MQVAPRGRLILGSATDYLCVCARVVCFGVIHEPLEAFERQWFIVKQKGYRGHVSPLIPLRTLREGYSMASGRLPPHRRPPSGIRIASRPCDTLVQTSFCAVSIGHKLQGAPPGRSRAKSAFSITISSNCCSRPVRAAYSKRA